jgi:hypothetical protein
MDAIRTVFGLLGLFIVFSAHGTEDKSAETVAQDFFNYLLKPTTNIAVDVAAQQQWLALNLQKLLIETSAAVTAARRLPEVDGPDPAIPDNHTFLDSWDAPTTCRTASNQATTTMVQINMVCRWGTETNYPGSSRNATVLLAKQDSTWHITDIQMHKSEYGREFSLEQALVALMTEAEALANHAVGVKSQDAPSGDFKH